MPTVYHPRQAVRGLLIDRAQREVLLIQSLVPDTNTLIWLAPGGGLEPGEAPLDGLFREISEETGLTINAATGPVWTRRMKFTLYGKAWDQSEAYYYVPVTKFEPNARLNPAQNERNSFRAFRWWSAEAIAAATDEIFVPLTFADHYSRLLNDGPRQPAYDVGR